MDLSQPTAAAAAPIAWREEGGLRALGSAFYQDVDPTPLPAPHWVARSGEAAALVGVDPRWLAGDEALQAFAGNALLPGSRPIASVYGGHQFGVWAGQLGDGRALLLGETATGWELALKGSGPTPYSRMGDGRAVLRSSIREFLASEAMAALAVPTTRALCLVGSPAPVLRERVESAAVLTRAAPSWIRFGHFELLAARGQTEELRRLAEHVIARFYPDCAQAANPGAALLHAVVLRTAELLAHWQALGFCHGVMNTDNMSILGLTLDYGPFQFMDGFDPRHVCNHSDSLGRYAFGRQPAVAHWNLRCLAEAMLPLIRDVEAAQAALDGYAAQFEARYLALMRARLGLQRARREDADALVERLVVRLADARVDYPAFWQRLSLAVASGDFAPVRELFADTTAWDAWLLTYQELLAQEGKGLAQDLMQKTNPRYVLRNHLAERVIRAAEEGDLAPLQQLQALLARPFDEHPGHEAWADLPPAWASSLTLSCSS